MCVWMKRPDTSVQAMNARVSSKNFTKGRRTLTFKFITSHLHRFVSSSYSLTTTHISFLSDGQRTYFHSETRIISRNMNKENAYSIKKIGPITRRIVEESNYGNLTRNLILLQTYRTTYKSRLIINFSVSWVKW